MLCRRRSVSMIFAVWLSAASVASADVRSQARGILERTKVQGGLIVHLNCGVGALTAALRADNRYLVQGLDTDRDSVNEARRRLAAADAIGGVTVRWWNGHDLPYTSNLVDLVVSERPLEVPTAEVLRVLAPGGVACVKQDGQWTLTRKPRPTEMDEWTHYLYDASGNVAGHDRLVGPPQRVQWRAEPTWNRGTKTSCLVSSGGRVFYILNSAHFATNEIEWTLLARDAFNGKELWRRPLKTWRGGGSKKIGPIQIHRKLIASGDRVYVTLGAYAPISVLDAATGKVLRELEGVRATEEMVLVDGILAALVNRNAPPDVHPLHEGVIQTLQGAKSVVALRADTGEILWDSPHKLVLPLTLAADSSSVLFHDGESIVCLELLTGAVRWRSAPTPGKLQFRPSIPADGGSRRKEFRGVVAVSPQYGPTLVRYRDIVAFAGGHELTAYAADDGRRLWSADCPGFGYSVPIDVLGVGDLLWAPDSQRLEFVGRDLHTGEIQTRFQHSLSHSFPHHRCYRMKCVDHTVLASRAGVEFVDLDRQSVREHHWIRGSCLNGVMPCNGLLYVPPHNCVCYIRAKLAGFYALTPDPGASSAGSGGRLEHGPAFRAAPSGSAVPRDSDDWPTYRGDLQRSGAASTEVPARLAQQWKTRIGGRLTSPVIADGRVFVASIDSHQLFALDADDGRLLWRRTAGGRIDSPPTIYQGMAIFGCADGTVSCLRAADGQLIWRFQAAPGDRQIVACEQLESPWPVSGSVLVVQDTVCFVAGRSSYVDGGLRFYRLDPRTGEQLSKTVIATPDPQTGVQQIDQRGVVGDLPDVLSFDGEFIYMRHRALDLNGEPQVESHPHLHSPTGYLDDSWHERSFWVFGREFNSPSIGAFFGREGRARFAAGRILVCDNTYVYGYGRNLYPAGRQTVGVDGAWCLFATTRAPKIDLETQPADVKALWRKWKGPQAPLIDFRWRKKIPIQVWGLTLAGDILFLAGPPETAAGGVTPEDLAGERKGWLWAVSPTDGRRLASVQLSSPPVWDGLAAANRRLFVAARDGGVICLGPQ